MDTTLFWNYVKDEMEYRGYSLKYLCDNSDINYGTCRNQIALGKMPDVETIEKISRFMNVNFFDFIFYKKTTGDTTLSHKEKELIFTYRELSKNQQDCVLNLINSIVKD